MAARGRAVAVRDPARRRRGPALFAVPARHVGCVCHRHRRDRVLPGANPARDALRGGDVVQRFARHRAFRGIDGSDRRGVGRQGADRRRKQRHRGAVIGAARRARDRSPDAAGPPQAAQGARSVAGDLRRGSDRALHARPERPLRASESGAGADARRGSLKRAAALLGRVLRAGSVGRIAGGRARGRDLRNGPGSTRAAARGGRAALVPRQGGPDARKGRGLAAGNYRAAQGDRKAGLPRGERSADRRAQPARDREGARRCRIGSRHRQAARAGVSGSRPLQAGQRFVRSPFRGRGAAPGLPPRRGSAGCRTRLRTGRWRRVRHRVPGHSDQVGNRHLSRNRTGDRRHPVRDRRYGLPGEGVDRPHRGHQSRGAQGRDLDRRQGLPQRQERAPRRAGGVRARCAGAEGQGAGTAPHRTFRRRRAA